MKKTMELLKNAGIIEKLQRSFDRVKPSEDVKDETIMSAIESIFRFELEKNFDFFSEVLDAMVSDAVTAIKDELTIEYVASEDYKKNALDIMAKMLEKITEKMEKDGE